MPCSAKLELIEPCAALAVTYRSFIHEFLVRNEPLVPVILERNARDFGSLIRRLRQDAAGVDLPAGYVPASCFWLVDEHKTLVGVSHFRHSLNAALSYEGGHIGYSIRPTQRNKGYGKIMLKLLLERAKALDHRARVRAGTVQVGILPPTSSGRERLKAPRGSKRRTSRCSTARSRRSAAPERSFRWGI